MKPNDPNQGEGDKLSARHYNRKLRQYVANGDVDEAARRAKDFVEQSPGEAERAEAKAKRGPGGAKVSLEDLVAKGRSVVDRLRPMLSRAVGRLRRK